MNKDLIKCPHCGKDIEVTEVLTHSIRESMRIEMQAELAKKEKDFAQQHMALKQKEKELEQQKESINEQISEKLKVERLKLADQKKAVENQQQTIEQQVADKLKAERKSIAESERKKIIEEQVETTNALKEELAEKSQKLSIANKKELELLKKQQELEQAQENIELEVQRKITEERKKISEEANKKAVEEQMLKMREKEDLIKAMQEQIENLKRKAETGSQEAQGEALEQEMQEYLERSFPYDRFEEVKKGARGADVLHIVHNQSGKECGKILWESKNTKDFQKTWASKLKSDQQEAKADIAVIMSIALPSEMNNFGIYDGVWVTDYKSAIGLATALRQGLIEATRQKAITAGRDTIKDVIYNYITSQEFALHIQAVVTAYRQMKEDLESEKRSMLKIWNKRDRQITTVLDNVTGIYGSIEGLIGDKKALPEIKTMTLESITEDEV
ncbi:MAG: DUF2130 domain-containing protein [Sedimentisphaerales bacterium]